MGSKNNDDTKKMKAKWELTSTAPKDGTMIIGVFGIVGMQTRVCMWNTPNKEWATANPQANIFHGENDMYFETEYEEDDDLVKWTAMP